MHRSKQDHFILHVPFPIGEGWQQIWRTALDLGWFVRAYEVPSDSGRDFCSHGHCIGFPADLLVCPTY